MIPSTIMDITNVSLTYQKNDDERIKNGAVLLASSHNLKSIAIETDAKPFIIIRHISSCQLEKIVIRTPFAQLSNSISSLIMRHVETIEELVLDNHCFGDGSSFDSSALSLIKNLTIIRLQLSPFNMFGKMIEEIPREKNPRWDIISLKVFDDEIDNFCRIYNAKLAFWRESKLFIDFILQHDITSKTFHILSNIIASSMNIARIWVYIYQREKIKSFLPALADNKSITHLKLGYIFNNEIDILNRIISNKKLEHLSFSLSPVIFTTEFYLEHKQKQEMLLAKVLSIPNLEIDDIYYRLPNTFQFLRSY